jgi:membrane fusion protein (multidrug efflux system)
MLKLAQRYAFAAVVVVVLAFIGVAVVGKAMLDGAEGSGAGPAQAAAGRGPGGPPGGGPPGGGGPPAPVRVATTAPYTFSDAIQAIGTAEAYESIIVTSNVTDTIGSIHFDSGDSVSRGSVLVRLSAREEQAQLNEARAAAEEAERARVRFQELFDRGFSPRAQLDQSVAAAERASAQVGAVEARLADRVIRAPFAGVVGLRQVSPGALVRPGDPIATLDDTSRIKLDFDVPETQIAVISRGVGLAARTEAYPGAVFEGEIDQVDSRINPTSRTVRVRAVLPNGDGRLRPGMLMTVEIRANPRTALAVPEVSVIDEEDGPIVFVAAPGPDGRTVAQRTPVRVGQRVAGVVEVLAGLSEGDVVVVEGVNRVRPGQTLQVVAAPATPARDAAEVPRQRT